MSNNASNTPPNAEDIFKQALYFNFAAKLLGMHNEERLRVLEEAGRHPVQKYGRARTIAFQRGDLSAVPCAIPQIVNLVLSIELYLKCLLTLESVTFRRIHEIKELYGQVSAPRQKRIKELYEENFSRTNFTTDSRELAPDRNLFNFEEVLTQLNKAFVQWRYAFERLSNKSTAGAYILCEAMRRAVIEVKQDWKPLVAALGKLPTLRVH